mgnify:CR=1 FL=1
MLESIPYCFIFSVIEIEKLFLITNILETIFSARKAGKISPIEAIRSNSEIKISSKKVRGSLFYFLCN